MGLSDLVKILIERGTPCMGDMVDRRPAISWAAAGGFVEIVDMFLSHDGSLINLKDEGKGYYPLILVVHRGHLETVKNLLGSRMIDVNLKNIHGQTRTHFAIRGPEIAQPSS